MNSPIDHTTLKISKPALWLATWFGCGLLRPAPGTWGSLGALPVAFIIFAALSFWGFVVSIVLVTIAGFWATDEYEKATQSHDASAIVIDEIAGQWIALLPIFFMSTFYNQNISPLLVICAFALFRVFDIIKPWPASYYDRQVKGAMGVMADDLVAGFYAALCVTGLIYARLG